MPVEELKLRPPSRSRLVDDVYRSLEEAILSGKMRPGDRVVESWIAEHLEISRTTVREALLMLERQGLVVSTPRRGTFVTRLSKEDALDLCYSRALLEGFAVRSGFSRITPTTLSRMERCVEEMSRCQLPEDFPRLIQIDLSFHHPLIECSGSPLIIELWSTLSGKIGALMLRGVEEQQAHIDYVTAFHQQLIEDLRSGDPEVAQQGVIDHYIRAEQRDAVRLGLTKQAINQLAPNYRDDFQM